MSRQHVLALDQGTTSSRAIVFDREGRTSAWASRSCASTSPGTAGSSTIPRRSGAIRWPSAARRSSAAGVGAAEIAAIGITNQRETTVLWERGHRPRRSTPPSSGRTGAPPTLCRAAGGRRASRSSSARAPGLVIDAYFSGTKLAWLLDQVPGARAAAERGALAFGTVDSLLLWRLTGGRVHATDATNASRTMLFDIRRPGLGRRPAAALRIPASLLPRGQGLPRRCSAAPTRTCSARRCRSPGIAGDQQAATVGQACFAPGMMKSTYGTGCFMLLNTGERLVASRNRLLTTVAYRLGGRTTYALEGSIFVAGAAVQWLRDGLG